MTDGTFHDIMRLAGTDFDTDLVMSQSPAGAVHGTITYGSGFIDFNDTASGDDLVVRWSVRPASGETRMHRDGDVLLRRDGDVLQGSWTDAPSAATGTFRLTRVP